MTGSPRLKLDLGSKAGDERWAAYASGSGTAMLEFAYTVAQSDASSVGVAVLKNTLALNGGTIRSASAAGENATLTHTGLGHDPAHRVDARPPRLSVASVNGASLTLTFDEALGAAASLANDAFTVKKTPQGGSEQDASLSGSPAIVGATVTLTLANEVLGTDTDVKISYTRPTMGTGNRLKGEADNEVASFSDRPVANSADTTPPELERGEIDGGTMTLYFSEPLDPDSVGGSYGVRVKFWADSWYIFLAKGDVEISGNKVTVGLGPHSPRAKPGFPASAFYVKPTDPTAKALRDLVGNPVPSTLQISLTNITTGPPSVTRGEVSSDAGDDDTYGLDEKIQVRLTFSEAVAVTGSPRVKIDFGSGADKKWAVYEEGSGTTMLEFAYEVAQGDNSTQGIAVLANTLELSGGTIRSVAKNEDAALGHGMLHHDAAHRVDARPPTLSAARVDGAVLTLTFDEALGATASLANGAFTVKKKPQGGIEQTVSLTGTPAIGGATVTLSLANAVLDSDTEVKVSYAKPTSGTGNRLRDTAGNEVASFSEESVTNGSSLPSVERAQVDGTELTITFDKALGAAASLTNGAFRVKKTPQGGSEQDVSLSGTPAITGSTVILTLANAVLETDTDVKVSYTKPATGTGNRLRDTAGNEVASFSDQAVSTDATPPRLVRGEIDGGTMTLYFSEALDPDSTGGRIQVTVRQENGRWYSTSAKGDVKINGNSVTVGLGSTFGGSQLRAKAGEQRNQAYYSRPTDPTAKSLRDLAGNPVRTPYAAYDGTFSHTRIIFLNNLTGVAQLSVADARANEGAGASVAFEVSLSSAATETVTVDYATADGTAEAGADYTATSGTLIFAAGETAKTVSVPVLDDAVDEGEETFTLRLSNATGARIRDGEAVGTIVNDDPLQKMWLARFGRTMASHVTDAVSDRLAAPPGGAQVTVAGQRVDLAGDGAALAQALTGLARALGASEQAGRLRWVWGRRLAGDGPRAAGVPDARQRAGAADVGPRAAAWKRVPSCR